LEEAFSGLLGLDRSILNPSRPARQQHSTVFCENYFEDFSCQGVRLVVLEGLRPVFEGAGGK
jgi:hypothetical protein